MQKDCSSIKILLAGDMPLLRDALRVALGNIENMEVVGAVPSYTQVQKVPGNY